MGTLQLGENEHGSAKRRRQKEYRDDLELQMREKEAARQRERYQGMSVNASGWLDPEKRPERLKPLGGDNLISGRSDRNTTVRPYHTLFNYGNSEATAGMGNHDSVTQAYNFFATRDLDRPQGQAYGSIIQPLVIPYVDNRPIIMPDSTHRPVTEYQPKYNPFQKDDEHLHKEIKTLLGLSQLENERLKAQLAKEYDEHQRKMRRELEERRNMWDHEAQARRRVEDMRKEEEFRRREMERQSLYAKRAKEDRQSMPQTAPIVVRPSSSTVLGDMNETKKLLIEERKRIEALLKAQKNQPDYTEVKVIKRPPPPPTPTDPDRPNKDTLQEFTTLKHKEAETRQAFRRRYPDIPETNTRLEHQQRALILQQQQHLSDYSRRPAPRPAPLTDRPSYTYRRPDWMDRSPTPFPHRLRDRDRLYTTLSLDGDLDRIHRRTEQRENALNSYRSLDPDAVLDRYEKLKLSARRPCSTDTLTDDTWLMAAT